MTTEKIKKRGERTQVSVASLLSGLEKMERQRKLAEDRVDDAVAMLRSPDSEGYCLASWQEIADALHLSRQGAQQRYARRGR